MSPYPGVELTQVYEVRGVEELMEELEEARAALQALLRGPTLADFPDFRIPPQKVRFPDF